MIKKTNQISQNYATLAANPFDTKLDLDYKLDKINKAVSASFRLEDLSEVNINKDITKIKNLILRSIDSDTLYTTYIKIRYSNNLFIMAGNQMGFKYNSVLDLLELLDVVLDRTNQCLEKYSLDGDEIAYVQLIFIKVNTSITTEFSKKDIKSTSNTNKSITKFATDKIAISVEENSLGTSLNTHSNSDGYIDRIDHKIKGVTYNFMDKILDRNKHLKHDHADKVLKLTSGYKFYLVST